MFSGHVAVVKENKRKNKSIINKCAINLPVITFASSSDVFCLPMGSNSGDEYRQLQSGSGSISETH